MVSKNCKNPIGKSRKVAKFCFGADEVVVAIIPKRVGVMTLRVKGFT